MSRCRERRDVPAAAVNRKVAIAYGVGEALENLTLGVPWLTTRWRLNSLPTGDDGL